MTGLAARNPQAFGPVITGFGVLVFVPDVLVLRLTGGDLIAVAVFRGLQAGLVSMVELWLIRRRSPSCAVLRTGPGLAMMLTRGIGRATFCAAVLGHAPWRLRRPEPGVA